MAREQDDRHAGEAVTDFGEWGPWINGGAWLQIEGRKVDWLYRDLTRVTENLEQSKQGWVAVHYQPGHPFGFPSYFYMAEVSSCLPLSDPQGEIAALKAPTIPCDNFPLRVPELRATLEDVLGHPGTRSDELRDSLQRIEGMVTAAKVDQLLRQHDDRSALRRRDDSDPASPTAGLSHPAFYVRRVLSTEMRSREMHSPASP